MFISSKKFYIKKKKTPTQYNLTQYVLILINHGSRPPPLLPAPLKNNNSYFVLLEPVATTIEKACARLPGLVILQADGVQCKFGMVSSKLKVIRQIPQKSLTSAVMVNL